MDVVPNNQAVKEILAAFLLINYYIPHCLSNKNKYHNENRFEQSPQAEYDSYPLFLHDKASSYGLRYV